MTKKLYSDDKIKINFDVPTLLKGWDANKESDNASLLFEKEGLYYLGIMHPKHKHLFNYVKSIKDIGNEKKLKSKDNLYDKVTNTGEGGYRKIVYKQISDGITMLSKVLFSKSRMDLFAPSDEILKIRNTASHTKNG
ncbi:MAG: hypothetical protein L3J44_03685, partial [Campylobacteraceae bacterium]|nr:hypothetical protein [Campylobacteraceae bacterium]